MDMEIILFLLTGTQVSVSCGGEVSHTFDLHSLLPEQDTPDTPRYIKDLVAFRDGLYRALFPSDSLVAQKSATLPTPSRVVLVTTDDALQARFAYRRSTGNGRSCGGSVGMGA